MDAVADQFGVSVGVVIKRTRRDFKALPAMAAEPFKRPSAEGRGTLSQNSGEKYEFAGCIRATDGTAFFLAYQPAFQPQYYDSSANFNTAPRQRLPNAL